jgi:hypothetical protein
MRCGTRCIILNGRQFLDRLNRGLNFLVIVLGAGVVSKMAPDTSIQNGLELAVVILSTAQLVFDFGGAARDHEFLQRRYFKMVSEMEAGNPDDAAEHQKWSTKLLTIAADEPMTMRALDAVAYNNALDSLYSNPDDQKAFRQHVPQWCYLLRNVFAFQGRNFHPKV